MQFTIHIEKKAFFFEDLNSYFRSLFIHRKKRNLRAWNNSIILVYIQNIGIFLELKNVILANQIECSIKCI